MGERGFPVGYRVLGLMFGEVFWAVAFLGFSAKVYRIFVFLELIGWWLEWAFEVVLLFLYGFWGLW